MMKKLFAFLLAMVAFSCFFIDVACAEIIKYRGNRFYLEEMVARCSTEFDITQHSRNKNIKRASELINGKIIMPNEEISFNELVGPRTKGRGFVVAGSFANGKKVTSIGGGICQVSSTWSGATINLGLKILERHKHSLPVTYIGKDKEATVSWGYKDFRFKNNTKNIFAVKVFIIRNVLHVQYWKCRRI